MTNPDPHTTPSTDPGTDTADRRRAARLASDSAVQVSIETSELEGVANNVSQTGILFFTDGELRISVEFTEDGERKKLSGKMVRCERIKGDRRGWAVEFDRP